MVTSFQSCIPKTPTPQFLTPSTFSGGQLLGALGIPGSEVKLGAKAGARGIENGSM